MEKLFENLFVPTRYQVLLATHFLDRDVEVWWRRVRPDGPLGAELLSMFYSLQFGAFFPNSVKQKLEKDLSNLLEVDRTVQVSRPGVETATRARQQIRHPYGKPRIGEASYLQKKISSN